MTIADRLPARGTARIAEADVPAFEPHPWLSNGHLQTIGGRYLPGPRVRLGATAHIVALGDGDRLCVQETVPAGWRAGGPSAVLVHGLAGCAESPYVVRVARRLVGQGIRVVRMNLRGAGAGFGLARGIYHSGRTEDLRAVTQWLAGRTSGGPIALVGFSLGASLVLKLAAEAADRPVAGLDSVLAANPPLDLAACSRYIQRPAGRLYDRNFVRQLRAEVARLHARWPALGPVDLSRVQTLYQFDACYTAPRHGFEGADAYYHQCSAGPDLARITLPGLVVHAQDDPFIPAESVRRFPFPPSLALELLAHGGHLGYISRTRWGGDRRWLDARLTAWLTRRWASPATEVRGD